MSWRVVWCDEKQDEEHPIQKSDASSEQEVVSLIQQALQNNASDISITKQPPEQMLGGVPYPEILQALKSKTVVPFLGAGVPFSGRPIGAEWRKGSPFLPSGAELARHLAFQCDLPIWKIRDTDNLARVASYYTITNPGANLADELRTIFAAGNPTPVHELLAEPELHPMLIVTTNYDTLMEQALDAKNVSYDTVIHCTDIQNRGCVLVKRHGVKEPEYIMPGGLSVDLKTTTVLYKMHGSINRDTVPPQKTTSNFVITEEDYVNFLSGISSKPPNIPPMFREHFQRSSFLFLGYSLEDWNIRVILDSINDAMSDAPGGDRRRDEGPRGALGQLETANTLSAASRSGDPAPLRPNPVAQALSLQMPQSAARRASRRHWAIQYAPTSYDVEVWKGRNVVIRNIDLSKFVLQLRSRLFSS
jgi:hypothetical protein